MPLETVSWSNASNLKGEEVLVGSPPAVPAWRCQREAMKSVNSTEGITARSPYFPELFSRRGNDKTFNNIKLTLAQAYGSSICNSSEQRLFRPESNRMIAVRKANNSRSGTSGFPASLSRAWALLDRLVVP